MRLGTELAKPFIEIAGKPILNHTLEKFINIQGLRQIIIVASPQNVSLVQELTSEYSGADLNLTVVEGGKERQDSIYNALEKVQENVELVMVHDAVRPFVKSSQVLRCIESASEHGAAVLAMPVKDTIKNVDAENFVKATPDRSKLWQVQTPQVFKAKMLVDAYEWAMKEGVTGTDDSSLMEAFGGKVKVVEGDMGNFKITYPIDLKMAEQIIKGKA